MTYIVTAPLVIAKKEDGGDLYLYEGAPVPSHVPAAAVERFSNLGFIRELEDGEPVPASEDGDEDGDEKPKPATRRKPISQSN